jgi:hypothetical protein
MLGCLPDPVRKESSRLTAHSTPRWSQEEKETYMPLLYKTHINNVAKPAATRFSTRGATKKSRQSMPHCAAPEVHLVGLMPNRLIQKQPQAL